MFNVLSGLIDFAFDVFVLIGIPFLIVRSIRRGIKRRRENKRETLPSVRLGGWVRDDNPWAGWKKDSKEL